MNKKILITGCNGFISKKLFNLFVNYNYDVNCTNRNNIDKLHFDLKDSSDRTILPKFDILIHLAYFRNKSNSCESRINIEGSRKIFEIAKKYNAKIIYISSQSADRMSHSSYGKTKYIIEKIAKKFDAYILRPGLIYDVKTQLGLFGLIEKLILKSPFLFVPSGLNKSFNLCNIDLLLDQIHQIILEKNTTNQIDVWEKEKYSLNDLVKKIVLKNNKKIRIIKINYRFIYYIIKICEVLNFRLGFKSDSLKSLL